MVVNLRFKATQLHRKFSPRSKLVESCGVLGVDVAEDLLDPGVSNGLLEKDLFDSVGGYVLQGGQHHNDLAVLNGSAGASSDVHPLTQGLLGVVLEPGHGGDVLEPSPAPGRHGPGAAAAAGNRLVLETRLVEYDLPGAGELLGGQIQGIEVHQDLPELDHLVLQTRALGARHHRQERGRVQGGRALGRREEEQVAPGGLQSGQLVVYGQPGVGDYGLDPGNVDEEQAGGVLAQKVRLAHPDNSRRVVVVRLEGYHWRCCRGWISLKIKRTTVVITYSKPALNYTK